MKRTSLHSASLIFSVFAFLLFTSTVSAWDDCPFGYENEPYPGKCGRYIDTNNDGICDHSQSKPSTGGTTETIELEGDTQSSSPSDVLENRNVQLLIISFVVSSSGIVLTKILRRKNLLSNSKEKLLWNLLLLVFFLPS